MVDNRSLEKKLLALSKGEEVELTEEEKHQIGLYEDLAHDEFPIKELDKNTFGSVELS